MQNVSESNPSHPSAILLRQARQSWDEIHAHRLENLRKQAKDLLDQIRSGDAHAISRFRANHPHFPKERICLADAQSVIAREHGFASWPKMKASLNQLTLADEVERIHRKLHADGKDQFVPILTEESLKSAILKGIQSYEADSPDLQKGGGSPGYWHDTIKPVLLDAAQKGIWSEKGMVDIYYEQKDDRGVTYEGLGASLEMRTPGAAYPGFSLAILDLWYGRF
jgi:hypothetical protein